MKSKESMMDAIKRQKLKNAGWKVGTVAEFLDLSPSETDLVELKLALSDPIKQVRTTKQTKCLGD